MKADEFFDQKGIEYEEIVQDEPTKGCDEAARERGVDTSQIVKSLIVESSGEKIHVLLPGDRELSERKLSAKYRMVPPDEAEKITGFEPGTVHPFSTDLPHRIDERVLENERVSHTVGETRRGVIIDADEFRTALEEAGFDYEVADFVVSDEEDVQDLVDLGLNQDSARYVAESGSRSVFIDLSESFSTEMVLTALKEFDRHDLSPEEETVRKVLERSDTETHLQKLVEHLEAEGELPEESEGFDLEEIVGSVVEQNPEAAADYRDGKDSAINHMLGRVMSETNGRADGGTARELLEEEIRGD